MKFTLTTSFYNNSEDIDKLYKSIQAQTYKNWEWVVTDDFSEKNSSKEILLNISKADRRVKYVEQSFKKEMFWNPQNFCRSAEIIVQLDSDDYPLPKGLETYHHFFTKFPDVILIVGPAHNYYDENTWRWFETSDTRLFNNLSSGIMTFFRAWRNNPNVHLDFNPENKMKYFYNDYSIVSLLEEHGKVLYLPRNLYHRTSRKNSVSIQFYPENKIQDIEKERTDLFNTVRNRRLNPDINTLNRFFEPISDFKFCFTDRGFCYSPDQFKISFFSNFLDSQKESLIKELYFDHDFNFNHLDGNEDFLIYDARTLEDFESYVKTVSQYDIKHNLCCVKKSFIDFSGSSAKLKYLTFSEENEIKMRNLPSKYGYKSYFIDHPEYILYRIYK